MGWLDALRSRRGEKEAGTLALYNAVVRAGRAPHWYVEGGAPDTVDGRFDVIATLLAVTLLRLEQEPEGARATARLTERFVEDMEGQIRQLGIGDVVVGKHVGRMMSMLGGRLGAYRTALEDGAGTLDAALLRNLYRGEHPGDAALAHARTQLLAWRDALAVRAVATLLAGELA